MEILNSKLFTIGTTTVTLFWIIKLLLIVIFGFIIATIFKSKILKIDDKYISSQKKINIANFGYYLIAIGFITVGFSAIGLDLTSFTIIVGALSVGIGFGLQTLISNFASGLVLAFENSIKIGDLIKLNNGEIGRVKAINMRATIITTFDNIDIIVPNSLFITQNITNYTYSDDIRRLVIKFNLSLDSDIERVKKVVIDSIIASELKFIRDDANYPVDVRLLAIENGSLDFGLIVFIRSNEPSSYDYHFLPVIFNALKESSIAVTAPTVNIVGQNS